MMKTCPRCKEPKEDTEFHRNPKTGVLAAYCHPCKKAWAAEWRARNRDKERERQREYRQKNWDSAKKSQYKWREANPEKWAALQAKWRANNLTAYTAKKRASNRDAVFQAYGGYVCCCCGEDEPMFMTIDHIDNDGAEHRRELGTKIGRGGSGFFDWLRRNNFPPGFQVLCRNCNWGKHANGGVCPHQKP